MMSRVICEEPQKICYGQKLKNKTPLKLLNIFLSLILYKEEKRREEKRAKKKHVYDYIIESVRPEKFQFLE